MLGVRARQPATARRWWTWLRRVGLLLAAVLALEYVAVHSLGGAWRSWTSARAAAPMLLVLALLVELGSLSCYSGITRAVLPPTRRPSYPIVLAIDLTGNGFSHVVPGGGATAAALRFRLFGRAGVRPADAVGAAALESAVTTLWLVVAFLLGLVAAVPSPATHPLLRSTAVLAVLLIAVFGGLVAVLMARPDQVAVVTHRLATHVPLLAPQAFERLVRSVIVQVRLVLSSPARRRRAIGWAFASWSLDAASLYLCLLAFDVTPSPGGVLTAYAMVCLLALLPLTPGGLGLVEGVAVPTLASFGLPHAAALLGVLAWRLGQFWLPIPIGLASYLALRRHERHGAGQRTRGRWPRAPGGT